MNWNTPAGCPSAQDVRARWMAMLSGPPRGTGTMIVDADVTATADDAWTLSLTTRYGDAVDARTLQGRSCTALGDAVATIVAVALDPDLESADQDAPPPLVTAPPTGLDDSSPTRPAPTPASNEPVVGAPTPTPTTAASPRTRSPGPDGFLRPIIGLEYGALPGVTAQLGVAGGLLWPRVRLELEAGWLTPRTFAGPAATEARAQMFVFAGHGCARPGIGAIEFPVCAGLEAGVVRAVPVVLEGGRAVRGPWLGPSVRAGVARRFRRVGVWAAAGVVARGWATQLEVVDTIVFRPNLVSVRVAAGLEIFLGRRGIDSPRRGHKA